MLSKKIKAVDKYIRLERRLDMASNAKGRLIERQLSKLEIVEGITTDDVKARKQELKRLRS